jgi:hypothetical protein
MKTVKEWRDEEYYVYTGQASQVNRTLALGGIGVVWLFNKTAGTIDFPPELNFPVLMFGLSLFLDLMHYMVGGVIWHFFTRRMEKKRKPPEHRFGASPVLPGIVSTFYWMKLCTMLIGYAPMLVYLFGRLP